MKRRGVERIAGRLGLPAGLWGQSGQGLVAVYDQHVLTSLAWWEEGVQIGTFLELQPRQRRGVLRTPAGSGGTEDREVYADGCWERFDAWSDNQRPQRLSWARWTARAVTAVLGRPGCLLCGNKLSSAPAAAHLVHGHLCAACWSQVGDTAPTPRQWPLGERVCGSCGRVFADDEALHEGSGGKVCPACLEAAVQLGWLRW